MSQRQNVVNALGGLGGSRIDFYSTETADKTSVSSFFSFKGHKGEVSG